MVRVRLRMAKYSLFLQDGNVTLDVLRPIYGNQTLTSMDRASLVLLAEHGARLAGVDSSEETKPIFEEAALLDDRIVDLRLSLADARLQNDDVDGALRELQEAKTLQGSSELLTRILESASTINDRQGNIPEAISLYASLLAQSTNKTSTTTALLSLADLERRNNNREKSLGYLNELMALEPGPRSKSRALLIQGRLHETNGDVEECIAVYQEVIYIENGEPESIDEARSSLARIINTVSGYEFETLPADVLAQAKLGQARQLLDSDEPSASILVFESVIGNPDLETSTYRSAKVGLAEAYSARDNILLQRAWSVLRRKFRRRKKSHRDINCIRCPAIW